MLFVILLFACTTATGTWEGKCTYDSQSINVELDLDEEGGVVSGDAKFSSNGETYDGDVEGERDEEDVELDIEVSSGGTSVVSTFEGEIDGDDLDGNLGIESEVGGLAVVVVADCELERD